MIAVQNNISYSNFPMNGSPIFPLIYIVMNTITKLPKTSSTFHFPRRTMKMEEDDEKATFTATITTKYRRERPKKPRKMVEISLNTSKNNNRTSSFPFFSSNTLFFRFSFGTHLKQCIH